jgi:mannose-1-phosphate guanylyltransferase
MKSRRLWIALAILLLITVVSLGNQTIYHEMVTLLTEQLSRAIAAATVGDHTACSYWMQIFEREAERRLPFFNMTTSHHEVDEFMSTLTRAKTLLDQQNLADFLVEADQLQTRLAHIDASEQLLWDNIL